MHRVMLVDDEENVLRALVRVLRREKLEVETYTSAPEALRRLEVIPFDVIVADYRMPEMNGVEFLTQAKRLQPQTMRLILSGMADRDALEKAINQAEIYRFVSKPWDDDELRNLISATLEERHRRTEDQLLAEQARRKGPTDR